MILSMIVHKLAKQMNRISNVRASDREVNEAAILGRIGERSSQSIGELEALFHRKHSRLTTQQSNLRQYVLSVFPLTKKMSLERASEFNAYKIFEGS